MNLNDLHKLNDGRMETYSDAPKVNMGVKSQQREQPENIRDKYRRKVSPVEEAETKWDKYKIQYT